jgi:ATP-binding cassette subfamily F protein 3
MHTTGLARTPAAQLLHRFLFSHDDLTRPIGSLSGGEKSRLQLARLVHEKVNFLILDEPTNHLDLQACEQLEEMLVEFDGTLLVISHDRFFLERLVDRVVEVRERGLHLFRGSFADWWQSKHEARERRRKGALELRSRASAEQTAKEEARRERDELKALRTERRRLAKLAEKLGARIESVEARREELFARMQLVYGDETAAPDEGRRLSAELAALDADLAVRYAEWERTVEEIDRCT